LNAGRLIENYERIADACDAISRLRRFVLDLAVRGKLVPQDRNDEPVSELLKRTAEDQRLAPKRRGRSNVELAISEFDNEPFELPTSWQWIRFGKLHDLVRGVTYAKPDASTVPTKDHIPILRANNIGKGLNFDELLFVKKTRVNDEQKLRSGDYLIALSSGSKNLVGKAAFVNEDHEVAFGAFCGVIRLYSSALAPFVGVYLASRLYRDRIAAGSRGIGINNLKKETLSNLWFPLPPLAEQRRIVAKVDELMALCDNVEAARVNRETTRDRLTAATFARYNEPDPDPASFAEHARSALESLKAVTTRPDQIKHLRQAILNLAVRGKLVPQDPNDEPQFPQRIALERARLIKTGKIRKLKSLPPVPQDTERLGLVSGWIWLRLGAVSTLITKGSTPTSYGHSYTAEGVNFIKVESIKNGKLLPANVKSFISNKTNEFLSRSRLSAGDILFSIAGSIGTCAVVPEELLPANTNQALAIIRGTQAVFHPEFLLIILRSSIARAVLEKARGGAMNNVSLEDIETLIVPLPPLAEQRRIVGKVQELMVLSDRLEASLAAGGDTRQNLLDALIADALATTDRLRELDRVTA